MKLEGDNIVENMFFMLAEYASLMTIVQYADQVRSNEEIIACLKKPKFVDESISILTQVCIILNMFNYVSFLTNRKKAFHIN